MMRWRQITSLILALAFTALVADAGYKGVGPLPPLGPAFTPIRGVWSMARGAQPPHTQPLTVPGLRHPVSVAFSKNGTAYIKARTDHDLFLAIGYMQAKNRLFQMDLMRRQGEGLLSQIIGPAALSSDKFELELGLLRTARTNWLLDSPQTRQSLLAYSRGVNDVIQNEERNGTLPVMFKLLGYRPAPWTPVDSLVIQGDMTQDLDYTTAPIEYSILKKSLGSQRTRMWIPTDAPNPQHPYDLGPYAKRPLTPMPSAISTQTSWALTGGVPTGSLTPLNRGINRIASSTPSLRTVNRALNEVAAITNNFRHSFSDSNNWAVSGAKTANGQAMMAGDPHLMQTLPAIWYQIAGSAPGYNFSGVSIPGIPMIVIGHNANIAWSLTNVQNQATFMYREKIRPHHPNQYLWKGGWHTFKVVRYQIPVKGRSNGAGLTVRLTVHGPMMTQSGQTLAVDWVGALPSDDLQSILDLARAKNFSQFKRSLSFWHAPSQNFVYADNHGNIGLISAGYYAEVAHGNPAGILPGSGQDDISGTIPYSAIPQAYNPPSGLVFSANQREVLPSYPYYLGNTLDFFDPGYRADTIFQTLIHAKHLTPKNFAQLQSDIQDNLAQSMIPQLLAALQNRPLNPTEAKASALLREWNDSMGVRSPQATIWWYFINQYLSDTFLPWWHSLRVPISQDPNLALTANSAAAVPLIEDLQAWTAKDPGNAAFSLPNGTRRNALQVMSLAFSQTISLLSKKLGPNPQNWQWGHVHFRHFASLTQIAALGYGPRGSGGDQWTVDAADSGLMALAGPSWRMIVAWQGPGHPPIAQGVYPGGQSENPLSPWYENQITTWWSGRYYPMLSVNAMAGRRNIPVWTLNP